jgi:hypothetical protein
VRELSIQGGMLVILAAAFAGVGAPLLFGQAATAIVVVALAGVALSTFARLSRIDMGLRHERGDIPRRGGP